MLNVAVPSRTSCPVALEVVWVAETTPKSWLLDQQHLDSPLDLQEEDSAAASVVGLATEAEVVEGEEASEEASKTVADMVEEEAEVGSRQEIDLPTATAVPRAMLPKDPADEDPSAVDEVVSASEALLTAVQTVVGMNAVRMKIVAARDSEALQDSQDPTWNRSGQETATETPAGIRVGTLVGIRAGTVGMVGIPETAGTPDTNDQEKTSNASARTKDTKRTLGSCGGIDGWWVSRVFLPFITKGKRFFDAISMSIKVCRSSFDTLLRLFYSISDFTPPPQSPILDDLLLL